ncbi:hypothetical protein N7481_010332 [Penicillium waksmanii]|uniref:uncharacterized protein n=1 Tax=Penicillium waksmanii TaxID=69791 RepID=UPI002546EDBE|nr:uncharacterized protein N7481_010332 [Penicillium waksmanii]KAJ5976625.1 hypothetical protein N7481_010332 [Penicillium waksmanii]
MSSARQPAWLELLPSEILGVVVKCLFTNDMKHLSCVSKRLRDVSIPYLFRGVRFSFSDSGLLGLRRLMLSGVRQYVVSFTYVIPELLRPETTDFEYFRRSILPPENYAACGSFRPGLTVPYMLVYDTFKAISIEQQGLVGKNEDVTVLSAVFRRLPRLSELNLCFCQTLTKEHWMALFMDQTVEISTYGHHLPVLSSSLKVGRDFESTRLPV